MQGIIRSDTCLPAALAVVGDLKNIWADKTGDLDWIISPQAKDYLGGKYHPKHSLRFIERADAFDATITNTSGPVITSGGTTYWVASIRADLGEHDAEFVLVFDAEQCLLAITPDRDYAKEFKVLASAA